MSKNIDSKKIADLISSQIERYEEDALVKEIGIVSEAGDGIAKVKGLKHAMAGEMLEFSKKVYGLVLNLDKENIGAIILGDYTGIQEGDIVKSTRKILQVPVGDQLLGRIVDPLGRPLDNKGPIKTYESRPIEFSAPSIVKRQPVKEPLQTGIKAIDSMVPIGRGQRELVIGDRCIGKTAILVDTLINQKGKDVICIYVSIGQKTSTIARMVEKLEETGSMDHSIIVNASAQAPAALQYLAPYAGCAIGEYFMYSSRHALCLYDDLSKHAVSYRQISLLLRRPPGREAYPGDIFYLHARLLERAAKLSDENGGGSLTAIPVIETKGGDISAYIPTNVISITDGQIYLEAELFNAGVRPAINPGISVSRVGGSAQIKAMKKVSGMLRLDLAQYRELETFAKFGTELDTGAKKQLARGERTLEILKQEQFKPMDIEDQVLMIYALINGFLDDIGIGDLRRFEKEYLLFMYSSHLPMIEELKDKKDIDEKFADKIDRSLTEFKNRFTKES